MINYRNFEVLIFDLGNVIIDLNDQLVLDGLEEHGTLQAKQILDLFNQNTLLNDFEVGKILENDFFKELKIILGMEISFEEFEAVWNLTLHKLPASKLELLEKLKSSHEVLILSNTNSIHRRAFDKMVFENTGKEISEVVHKAYYSYEMRMRKPDQDIYMELIRNHDLLSKRALFFDDKSENIESADKVGIKGVRLMHPDHLWNYFNI